MKPVKVALVDKRLQDHANLFNIHLELWNRLKEREDELRKMFPFENPELTLRGTFAHLHTACKSCSSFSVTRPYSCCLEIKYDGREIPHEVMPAFLAFNAANRTVREITDKGPSLAKSVRLVLTNAHELDREVRVASLGSDARNSLDNFAENLEILETILVRVEEIEARTKALFDEFVTIQSDSYAVSV